MRFDGLRYHYVDEGSGPTLLLVHGNPTWSFAWRNLIKALSARYRVLAVDHIGCGFSDKPQNYPYRLAQHVANLERFVTGLNLRDVTLFAHDWGGAIGMGTATRIAGAILAVRALQYGCVSFAADPASDRRLPHSGVRRDRRPRTELVFAGRPTDGGRTTRTD